MIDSELGDGLRGGRVEVSKTDGVLASSTLEASCPSASTRSSSDFTCWLMTSCFHAWVLAARPGSPTPSWCAWPSLRCCWTAPATGGSSRSRATGWGTYFPTCPSSRAITSASARSRLRSSGCSTCLPSNRRPSVTGCGCLMAHRSPAASRAKPLGARGLRRLRLESLALAQLLGISARLGLRARRHADRL